jgi:ubiquinone/menaquinone biosynthesis C-methylase UbiE
LPFPDASFDTVCYIACINHIPERVEALRETLRVLKPGGRVVITMIGKVIGTIGHAVWWYSEDKHRDVHHDELMGMDSAEIFALLKDVGFKDVQRRGFVYGLNSLYVATKQA